MTGHLAPDVEVAVIGLARSGRAAAALLAQHGRRVYASDAGDTPELRESAEWLQARAVNVQLGGHDIDHIRRAGLAVVSPGISPNAAPVRAAREAGVPVVSEVAIALEALPHTRVIAVTGTNGKSTTTELIAHLLRASGKDAIAAGNIGRAVAEIALGHEHPEWLALEISSFQLHDTPDFSPTVGVVTNLAPDHLDRYSSVDEYYGDKQRIFAAADSDSRWVTNADDAAVRRISWGVQGYHFRFSMGHAADAHYDLPTRSLYLFGERLCGRAELRLLGDHNVANALAAALAVAVSGRDPHEAGVARAIGAGLRTFEGLRHRLEPVAERDGVLWINDSKATNVASARVAIEAMERPTVLLLGGRHKGEPYSELGEAMREHVRQVIAYGEAAPLIARDLAGSGIEVEQIDSDFDDVIQLARARARPGEVVLLSPACSSFDMFRDYEERGSRFRALVLQS